MPRCRALSPPTIDSLGPPLALGEGGWRRPAMTVKRNARGHGREGSTIMGAATARLVPLIVGFLLFLPPPAGAQRPTFDPGAEELRRQALERVEPLALALCGPQAEPLPAGVRFLVRFRGDVGGLRPGADVRIRGLRIGTVRNLRLSYDSAANNLEVQVIIDLVPDLLVVDGARTLTEEAVHLAVALLVERGLRAQVGGGALATPFVALTLIADAEPARLITGGELPEIPTAPARGERVMEAAEALLQRLEALPIEDLAANVRLAAVELKITSETIRPLLERFVGEGEQTLSALRALVSGPAAEGLLADLAATTAQVRRIAETLEGQSRLVIGDLREATKAAARTAEQTTRMIAGLETTMGRGSSLWSDLNRLVQELNGTARTLRLLLAHLERHPDALLRGRSEPRP